MIVLSHRGEICRREKKYQHLNIPSSCKIHLNICNIEILKSICILESGPQVPSKPLPVSLSGNLALFWLPFHLVLHTHLSSKVSQPF